MKYLLMSLPLDRELCFYRKVSLSVSNFESSTMQRRIITRLSLKCLQSCML
jgi:hypothetical protein